MRGPEIIDAEFEVIEPGSAIAPDGPSLTHLITPEDCYSVMSRSAEGWSFWRDDLPNLVGLVAGFAILIGGILLFGHH